MRAVPFRHLIYAKIVFDDRFYEVLVRQGMALSNLINFAKDSNEVSRLGPECDLNPRELVNIQQELKTILKQDEDQILFVSLGPSEGRGIRVNFSLGLPLSRFDAPCYVV